MTDHHVPTHLAVYDVDHWFDAGGSPAYFAALRAVGVSWKVANDLRSDAAVADIREARRRRMAYGSIGVHAQ